MESKLVTPKNLLIVLLTVAVSLLSYKYWNAHNAVLAGTVKLIECQGHIVIDTNRVLHADSMGSSTTTTVLASDLANHPLSGVQISVSVQDAGGVWAVRTTGTTSTDGKFFITPGLGGNIAYRVRAKNGNRDDQTRPVQSLSTVGLIEFLLNNPTNIVR